VRQVRCYNTILYNREVYSGDYNELIYLRARYYAPIMGRFLSRDTWGGDSYIPVTYNKWLYANANPVLYSDPSGKCPWCIIPILIAAGVISSGCTEQASPVVPVGYLSDCRNLNNWFVNELTDIGYDVHGDFDLFVTNVEPGSRADYRTSLREQLGEAIMFCWSSSDCGFYDVSTPGNIVYGYLGAQLDIPRNLLHDIASAGQLSEEIGRQLSDLVGLPTRMPPGLDINVNGFDSPGDFQAIELGYDLWETYHYGVTNEEFMDTLISYYSSLELRTPTIAYFTEYQPEYSTIGCGNGPP
jgi:RHS repeat-associated protein